MADQYFTASPVSEFGATVALSGQNAALVAMPFSSFLATITLSSQNAGVTAHPVSVFLASVNLTGASDTHGISVFDVVRDTLALWGVFCPKAAPSFAVNRALTDLNAAIQSVWNQANERNYWSSETITITLAANVAEQTLDADIQNVTGPCRLDTGRQPLVPIGTIGEFETFVDIYMDGVTAGNPVAFHVNRQNISGNDPASCIFMVTPTPTAETKFLLDVVKEAPRYTADDIAACTIIPIPHTYVESLLIPIVRYHASSFELFTSKELKESIDREYLQARAALGLADPLPGKAGDNLPKRKEEVAK